MSYAPCLALSVVMFAAASPAGEAVRDPAEPVARLCDGFKFTEGPASDGAGGVYFSDIPNQRIHHWSPEKGCSVFRENSGRANGLWVTGDGHLLACEGGNRRVAKIRLEDQAVTPLATHFGDKRFSSPNDLWPDGEGGWYFTDPRYGKKTDDLEIEGFHVYYIAPDGGITRVIDDLVKPNGIMGDRDRAVLYVADNGAGKIYAYPIAAPGKLGPGKLFYEARCDGMTLDARGNLYLTAEAVIVVGPEGGKVDVIAVPERPANVCFGGAEGTDLFITARRSLYRLRMAVKGGRGAGAGF